MGTYRMHRENADGSTTIAEVEGDTFWVESHVANVSRGGALVAAWSPGRWDAVVEVPGDQQGSKQDTVENGVGDLEPTVGFPDALAAVKSGYCIRRRGWNSLDQYVAVSREHTRGGMTQDFLWIRTAQKECVPWLASQSDLLGEDWEVLTGFQLGEL